MQHIYVAKHSDLSQYLCFWQTNDNQKKKHCFISKSAKIFKFLLRCTLKAYNPIWSISSSEAYILIKVCSIIPKWNEICGIRRTKARQNKVIMIILLQFRSEMKKKDFFLTPSFSKIVQNCHILWIWHFYVECAIQKMLLICFWFERENYCNLKSWRSWCAFWEN